MHRPRVCVLIFGLSLALGLFIGTPAAALAAPAHYVLVPEKSLVHFDARTTTHDFSGDTQTLTGEMDWDSSDPASIPVGTVNIPVAFLKTGVAPRDHGMRRMFDAKNYPQIEFRAQKAVLQPEHTVYGANLATESNPPAGYDALLSGLLVIRGIDAPLSIPVTKRILQDGSLEVEGDTQVSLETFGLEPPALMGFIRVLPDIKVHFKSVWKRAA